MKGGPLNSCLQMFFARDIFYQGLKVLFEIPNKTKRVAFVKNWWFVKQRVSKWEAVKDGCGDRIKDILDYLKDNGADGNKQKPFRIVLSRLKKELKKDEKLIHATKERKVHFREMCEEAIRMCGNLKDDNIRLFFGCFFSVDQVKQRFSRIAKRLNTIRDNNGFVNTYTQSLVVGGYVKRHDVVGRDKHAGKIRLCSGYRIAPDNGKNSKPGVLIHEASHLELHTKDYVYKEENCKNLAKERPIHAINNADSYACAAESD